MGVRVRLRIMGYSVRCDSKTGILAPVCCCRVRAVRLFGLCIAHNRPPRNASNCSEIINLILILYSQHSVSVDANTFRLN